jgi:hypothetical protein
MHALGYISLWFSSHDQQRGSVLRSIKRNEEFELSIVQYLNICLRVNLCLYLHEEPEDHRDDRVALAVRSKKSLVSEST